MSVSTHNNPINNVSWLCLMLLALILAFGLSWLLLIPLDFAYKGLYGLIDIDQHIAQFAPLNRLKQGFELTTDAERFRLFSAIVAAIHTQGAGLESLLYHSAQGVTMGTLLTQDEVIHLQDVAVLIDRIKYLLLLSAVLFIGLLIGLYATAQRMPTFRSMLLTVFGFLALAISTVLIIGPHKVFYTLHVWVFPEEHKWFFYYEESLMSTLMKAPDLFAYIAMLLLALAVPIFIFMMWLVRRVVA
ncbi:MAG: DUF1461 domain-containing protein [Leucothrix sp.]